MPSPTSPKNRAYKKAQKPRNRPSERTIVEPQPGFVVLEQRARGTKFCCCSCGKTYPKPEDNFIKSSSPLFYGWEGYVPICKTCADLYFQKKIMPTFDRDESRAMERICQLFDWAWDPDILAMAQKMRDDNMARGGKDNLVNCYSAKRQMKNFMARGQTYLDSNEQYWIQSKELLNRLQAAEVEAEEKIAEADEKLEQAVNLLAEHGVDLTGEDASEHVAAIIDARPDEEDVYFFGPGYTLDQYKYLREQYEDWISRYDTQTKAEEEIFKSLSIAQLNVQKAQAEGDMRRTTEAMRTLQELMDSARIKPKQKAGDALVEQNTFGTLIKQWEDEQPIPEPRDEWKDVDGIGKAVTTWFFGHLAKMFHIDNDASELYEREVAKYTVEPPRYEADEESDDAAFREKFNAMRGKKILKDEGGEADG